MSPSGTCLGSWGTSGTGAGQFRNPYGVQVTTDPVSGDELVYVADSNNDRVQVFDTAGAFVAQWGTFGDYDAPGTFSAIRRVAVDDEGGLWGADLWGWSAEHAARGPDPVPAYTSDRSIPAVPAAPPFTNTSVFNEARQVAFDGGDVLVMDTVNQRVVRMNATTGALDGPACGPRGWQNNAFTWPRGVAVDPVTHDLWVADTKQSQLQILHADCSFVAKLPANTSVPSDQKFNFPAGIAIRASDGTAWVADQKNHRIEVYDVATRALLAVYGSNGSGAGHFVQPQGIAIGPDGHVWVADTNNDRIVELAATPHAAAITWVRTVVSGLSRPAGVALDESGRIYIADTLHDRLVILNSGGSVYAIVDTGLSHAGERRRRSLGPDLPVRHLPRPGARVRGAARRGTGTVAALRRRPRRAGPRRHVPGRHRGDRERLLRDGSGPVPGRADRSRHRHRHRLGRRPPGPRARPVRRRSGARPRQLGTGLRRRHAEQPRAAVLTGPDVPDELGLDGHRSGQFTQVYGIAVGPGKLAGGGTGQVVYTTDGDRVQKFTTDGVFISQFGRKSLNQPRQLDVDPNTHDIYVASARDRKVVVFAPNGKRLFRFGGEGTGNGQFMGDIRGVEVSDSGRVFVSDDGNRRVQVFNVEGGLPVPVRQQGDGREAAGRRSRPDDDARRQGRRRRRVGVRPEGVELHEDGRDVPAAAVRREARRRPA